jgi:hypothetical protein
MEKKLYDDCFYVEQKRYGLWDSTDKDGKGLITSLNEEECVRATRWYLKQKQEGFHEAKTYDGQVRGKL